jgi:hypothetical protein
MNKSTYRVVKRDGGWAYEANATQSATFQTREAARKAARLAATQPAAANGTMPFAYEDDDDKWVDDSG